MDKKFRHYAIIVGIMVAVLFLGQAIGSTGAETEINGKEASVESLNKEIKTLEAKKQSISKENKEALDVVKKRDSIEADVKKLDSKYKALQKKVTEKEDLLDRLTVKMIMTKSKPIVLGAGQYVIGKDIPAGRYRASNVGEGSNFIVTSGEGDLKVNTILGSSGEENYMFFGETGDNLETGSSIKLEQFE